MDILHVDDDGADVRFSAAEMMSLYNLLVDSEAAPDPAVGARPHIRQIRERLADVVDHLNDAGGGGCGRWR